LPFGDNVLKVEKTGAKNLAAQNVRIFIFFLKMILNFFQVFCYFSIFKFCSSGSNNKFGQFY